MMAVNVKYNLSLYTLFPELPPFALQHDINSEHYFKRGQGHSNIKSMRMFLGVFK